MLIQFESMLSNSKLSTLIQLKIIQVNPIPGKCSNVLVNDMSGGILTLKISNKTCSICPGTYTKLMICEPEISQHKISHKWLQLLNLSNNYICTSNWKLFKKNWIMAHRQLWWFLSQELAYGNVHIFVWLPWKHLQRNQIISQKFECHK